MFKPGRFDSIAFVDDCQIRTELNEIEVRQSAGAQMPRCP
jgi:hypothetical protein